MRYTMPMFVLAALIICVGLQGCAVNVVTVNVLDSELSSTDNGKSETINESNVK